MPASGLLERLAGEAHLWLTPLAEEGAADRERAWLALLPADERAANRRFRVEPARRQHLAARALVRTTLSRYAEVEPRRWRFVSGPSGRPEIAGPAGLPPLRFNLSHTDGLVACLVTLGLDAGVDVELPREIRDPLRLAEHSFAPIEQDALRGLSGGARRQRFYDLWTLKEAFIKARGAGFLSLPARRFGYRIEDGRVSLEIDPELGGRGTDWQVSLMAPTERHRLAVAIRRGRRADLALAAWQIEPVAGEPLPASPRILARSASPRP